jgi:prevent-host-death family protein
MMIRRVQNVQNRRMRHRNGAKKPRGRRPRTSPRAAAVGTARSRRLALSEAREQLADAVNRVAYAKERITLHRHGKDLVALVPMEDLARLREIEDRMDVEAARAALREPGATPHEEVRRRLGV